MTTDRQWCPATGFTSVQFTKLLAFFTQRYFKLYRQTVAARHAELVITPTLTAEEEVLFFTLFSLKAGLTYDLLSIVSGMDAANAKRNQQLGRKVQQPTLATAQCLPRRTLQDAQAFKAYLQSEPTIIFDGLEQRLQQPDDNETSGKKNVTP